MSYEPRSEDESGAGGEHSRPLRLVSKSRRSGSHLAEDRIERAIFHHDRTAFAELIAVYDPIKRHAVAAWLRKFPGVTSRCAEDIQQDVWERLLAKDRRILRAWDRRRGHFRRFLWLVAFQAAMRVAPTQKLLRLLWLDPVDADVADQGASSLQAFERRIVARDLVAKLREATRTDRSPSDLALFDLLGQDEASKEIAKSLGVTPAAVHVRKSRLTKFLRAVLQDLDLLESVRGSSLDAGYL